MLGLDRTQATSKQLLMNGMSERSTTDKGAALYPQQLVPAISCEK